ncbi:ABC transporter ATP-binding protein [Pontixanthobacter sp.]|uniref:ABC transporter ATP-binding protein n=1 Tax=Pontixanthobacter sp. TaxID=2792078 RepID=UPI003C7CFB4C
MTEAALSICGLTKTRGSRRVLDTVDLTVEPGTVTAILGPSGAGKSTLLRAIAGLDNCDSGTIRNASALLTDGTIRIRPEQRGIGMVFQDFSLFPHLSVVDNVMFGLREGARTARRSRASAMLELVHLGHRAKDFPHTLSGGEQQRVALARALAPAPSAILLDEAFSGLDSELRAEVRDAALAAISAEGAAAVMVTHDAQEAMYMADTLALMIDGKIIQTGAPETVYLKPVSEAAARLLGDVNAWGGQVAHGIMKTPIGSFKAMACDDGDAVLLVRPETIALIGDNSAEFTVCEVHVLGHSAALTIASQTSTWHVRAPITSAPALGDRVRLKVAAGSCHIIPAG